MATYFGLHRLSSVAHLPLGRRLDRILAAHPCLEILSLVHLTSGSLEPFPKSSVKARYLIDG